jgi:hypothetical protein
MNDNRTDDYDDYFGLCPDCHKADGYANAGRTHVFFCKTHRKRWIAGPSTEAEKARRQALWRRLDQLTNGRAPSP